MKGLYVDCAVYDNVYLAAIFEDNPDKDKLKKFIADEYTNFTDEDIARLLEGEDITDSGSLSYEYYYRFYLRDIDTWEWL